MQIKDVAGQSFDSKTISTVGLLAGASGQVGQKTSGHCIGLT